MTIQVEQYRKVGIKFDKKLFKFYCFLQKKNKRERVWGETVEALKTAIDKHLGQVSKKKKAYDLDFKPIEIFTKKFAERIIISKEELPEMGFMFLTQYGKDSKSNRKMLLLKEEEQEWFIRDDDAEEIISKYRRLESTKKNMEEELLVTIKKLKLEKERIEQEMDELLSDKNLKRLSDTRDTLL